MGDLLTTSDAVISECGQYRYWLVRRWGDQPTLPFIMLNPSTADASVDDPTIRRCRRFAADRGYGGIEVVNLFAYRATSPADMMKAADPIGPRNNGTLSELFKAACRQSGVVVAAWGAHERVGEQARFVAALAADRGARMVCLGTTKDGHPRHPLYVKGDQPFEPFGAALARGESQ